MESIVIESFDITLISCLSFQQAYNRQNSSCTMVHSATGYDKQSSCLLTPNKVIDDMKDAMSEKATGKADIVPPAKR